MSMKLSPDSASTGRDCFTLSLAQQPTDAALPVVVRLTATGGDGPLETTVVLDSAATR